MCIRSNGEGILRIHILSEDKKINLEYPLFDSEVPVTPNFNLTKELLAGYRPLPDECPECHKSFER